MAGEVSEAHSDAIRQIDEGASDTFMLGYLLGADQREMGGTCDEHAAKMEELGWVRKNAATVDAGTIDRAAVRIELLSSLAREYLHRYGTIMAMMGDDVTEEILAIERIICEVAGKSSPMKPDEADAIANELREIGADE